MLQVNFWINVSIFFSKLIHFAEFFVVSYSCCFVDTFSRLKSKKKHFNRLLYLKRLLQHFVVNVFACCEFNNFNWIRQNQQRLRADCYQNLMNRIDENVELTDIDIKTSILFFNFTNDSRYIKIKKQNVLILIRRFEKSTFFITFTCNFKWFEFERDLFVEISIKNRFDFIARVFQLKLKKLFRDFIDRHVLKEVKIHFYVIEF